MENQLITDIVQEMLAHLDNHQMEQLHKVLVHYLRGIVTTPPSEPDKRGNENLLTSFLAAKRVEGCSSKSLHVSKKPLIGAGVSYHHLKRWSGDLSYSCMAAVALLLRPQILVQNL